MTIVGYSKITSKGQITLPKAVRNLLKVAGGQSVAFGVNKDGILLARCNMTMDKTPFSKAEWQKIEKMADEKGKVFDSVEDAKRHLRSV